MKSLKNAKKYFCQVRFEIGPVLCLEDDEIWKKLNDNNAFFWYWLTYALSFEM